MFLSLSAHPLMLAVTLTAIIVCVTAKHSVYGPGTLPEHGVREVEVVNDTSFPASRKRTGTTGVVTSGILLAAFPASTVVEDFEPQLDQFCVPVVDYGNGLVVTAIAGSDCDPPGVLNQYGSGYGLCDAFVNGGAPDGSPGTGFLGTNSGDGVLEFSFSSPVSFFGFLGAKQVATVEIPISCWSSLMTTTMLWTRTMNRRRFCQTHGPAFTDSRARCRSRRFALRLVSASSTTCTLVH